MSGNAPNQDGQSVTGIARKLAVSEQSQSPAQSKSSATFKSTQPQSFKKPLSGSEPARAFRKTGANADVPRKPRPSIVQQVVAELGNGMSIAECARVHALPRDFIEQVAQHAKRQGALEVVKLDGTCGTGVCNPDPDSIFCAGCPLVPASAKRTPVRTLRNAIRKIRQKSSSSQ